MSAGVRSRHMCGELDDALFRFSGLARVPRTVTLAARGGYNSSSSSSVVPRSSVSRPFRLACPFRVRCASGP